MKNIKVIIGVVIVVLIISVFAFRGNKTIAPATTDTATTTMEVVSTTPVLASELTVDNVKLHNTSKDCWSIVDGKVYDLTPWIVKHPGGSKAIISMCGIDASESYNDEHSGQKRPANELAGFLLGDLVK